VHAWPGGYLTWVKRWVSLVEELTANRTRRPQCAPALPGGNSRLVVAVGARPDHALRNATPEPSGSNGPKLQESLPDANLVRVARDDALARARARGLLPQWRPR